MRVGVLPTGDISVRAAHSLAAHPGVEEVIVIGPARSSNFPVRSTAKGCEVLIGSGQGAPAMAAKHRLPLIWDGESTGTPTAVWGASPHGLTLSLLTEVSDPRWVGLAHPDIAASAGRSTRFPAPVGRVVVTQTRYGGRPLWLGHTETGYAASYLRSDSRILTVVDDARFMSGVTLAAGFALLGQGPGPVWDQATLYLRTITEMGLVMAEQVIPPTGLTDA